MNRMLDNVNVGDELILNTEIQGTHIEFWRQQVVKVVRLTPKTIEVVMPPPRDSNQKFWKKTGVKVNGIRQPFLSVPTTEEIADCRKLEGLKLDELEKIVLESQQKQANQLSLILAGLPLSYWQGLRPDMVLKVAKALNLPSFPISCSTIEEADKVKSTHCKIKSYGAGGKPCFDPEEEARVVTLIREFDTFLEKK